MPCVGTKYGTRQARFSVEISQAGAPRTELHAAKSSLQTLYNRFQSDCCTAVIACLPVVGETKSSTFEAHNFPNLSGDLCAVAAVTTPLVPSVTLCCNFLPIMGFPYFAVMIQTAAIAL